MIDLNRIGYTIEHYKEVDNGRLQKYLTHHLKNSSKEEIRDAENFALSYLGLVQPTLNHLRAAAQKAQQTKVIESVIEDCVAYFKKSNDHLNDYQYGLYGLLDDAYRAMSLVSAIQKTVSNIELPFDNEKLESLNQSLQALLPISVVEKINAEVFKIRGNLLIAEIQNWAAPKQEKPTAQEVTLTNKKLNFPFAAYPILTDLSEFKGKKGIYTYTRLAEQNGKSTHYILYIGRTQDIGQINQIADKKVMDKTQQSTHICIYTYSQDDKTIKEWTTSLILQYHPPFNLKNPNATQKTKATHQQSYSTPSYNPRMKNCTACHGSGSRICSSCGGRGGRYQSRVDYDWEGRPMYRDEWINCYSCSGGYSTCTSCGGKGEVYA